MDLKIFLKEKEVWYRFLKKEETVHTADASEATGIELHRITKNLVSKTSEGDYALLVIPGDRRVNLKAAAKAIGVKNIRLIPFKDAEKISGFPPGGTPSVGHKTSMKVIVDSVLMEYETFFCGGGTRDKLLELKSKDVVKLTGAVVFPISRED